MIERLIDSDLSIVFSTAFGAVAALFLLAIAWVGIPSIERIAGNTVRRILTNSAVPIGAQLFNQAVNLVFAIFMLRLLGVTGNGQYVVATTVWLYAKTISDFGLGVLVTREVSRSPGEAGELLGSSTLLRLLMLLVLTPLIGFYVLWGTQWSDLSRTSAIAILLLVVTIGPSSYTEAVNSIFNGRERMEFPAILNIFTNLCRFGFGLAALVAGWGVIGLATIALVSTVLSSLAFHVSARHLDVRPRWRLSRAQARTLILLSWPLLLNALLLNLFFRADVFIIQASKGDSELGVYDAAYKFINMLPLIPAYFTLAVFPLLSRYAVSSAAKLMDSYRLAAKLLFIVAWPITIGTMLLAPDLIRVLAGEAFLPDSANALRILIWFAPVSYVNGITQYVLIAVNRQRTITIAFAVGVAFNFCANLLLVPVYGYVAAAAVTVATEAVLFVPLSIAVKRYVGDFNWIAFAIRPTLAAVAMGIAELATRRFDVVPALIVGLIVYFAVLVLTGAIGRREAEIARMLLGRSGPAVSPP
jgi:O-antigen/teichoic acid export membrane protein